MSNENLIFGIDLGTTYSSIGLYDSESHKIQVAMLNCENGSMLLPSAVYIESLENIVVGSTAISAGAMKPERLFRWFKRDMGTSVSDRTVDGQLWTSVELSAEILKTLKREAETYFTTEVKDVVITYPAYFNPQQRDLTKDAAELAKLNVVRMCEEPHAAAMAYVIEDVLKKAKDSGQTVENLGQILPQIIEQLAGSKSAVLVYDLGGGTFDVAMIQTRGIPTPNGQTELHFKTVFNDGNISLGGKDWDTHIMQLVADKDQEQNNHDPMNDPVMGRFDDDIETAKKNLVRLESTKVVCPKMHEIKITREEVNKRTDALLDKTRVIIENVIFQATNPPHEIEKEGITLLLAGGMCNWSPVKEMLTQVMDGRPAKIHKNLDYLVTYGAAYLGYLSGVSEEKGLPTPAEDGEQPAPHDLIKEKQPDVGGMIIPKEKGFLPCTPAIGIEVVDVNDPIFKTDQDKARKFVRRVIPSESEVGEFYKETFAVASDKQAVAAFVLYFLKEHEGYKDEETELEAWGKYKTFTLTFPPKPKGSPLYTDLRYTEGGVIEGKAYDDEGNEIPISGETSRS